MSLVEFAHLACQLSRGPMEQRSAVLFDLFDSVRHLFDMYKRVYSSIYVPLFPTFAIPNSPPSPLYLLRMATVAYPAPSFTTL